MCSTTKITCQESTRQKTPQTPLQLSTCLPPQKGWFGKIEVWYHSKGITNILSLKTLNKWHHVTYERKDRNGVFKIFNKEGVIEYFQHESWLNFLDLKDHHEPEVAKLTTVRDTPSTRWRELLMHGISKECWATHPERILREWHVIT